MVALSQDLGSSENHADHRGGKGGGALVSAIMSRIFLVLLLAFGLAATAAAQDAPLPRIVSEDGRHALLVDGEPYLILGGQANNSSNYPAVLPQVWPTIAALNANTLEIPVAWEQVEPVEGQFDFSWIDALIPQARENNVRLVLLWFGTWKNTSGSYVPEWVKADGARFPRMRTRDGKTHYVHSPHGRATLEADKRAFVAMMRHLKQIDPQHTVIMVQPQNEVGSYGSPRDFSPEANRLFAGQIPAELARKMGKRGTWSEVFGAKADSSFNAWYTARYIDEIAAAGQAEFNLPMYVNVVTSDPADPKAGEGGGASGGADWPVLDVWKAAAPHIAIAAPDLYDRPYRVYNAKLDKMARPDNPLFVPETGNDLEFARYFWLALGKGAIGWAPFGMDPTYNNFPLGGKNLADNLDAFASKFALMKPIAGDWARLAFEHPTVGFAKGDDASEQTANLGRWTIKAQYGLWAFGDPTWTFMEMPPHPNKDLPVGGAALIQLGPDEVLLAGSDVRISFALAAPREGDTVHFLSVEEGTFEDGRWVMSRRWNGDQTDYGLNLANPTLLKVRLGTYR
jgi:beta-galactosidase GanA